MGNKKQFLLNILIFISAGVSIYLEYVQSSAYYFLKPVTTILVILLVLTGKKSILKFRNTILLALVFCLLGDILLLKPSYFLFGLISFLIAHLLFAKSFIMLEGFQSTVILLLVLLAIGFGLYLWLYSDLGGLKLPVAIYIGVILFMAWQGIGLYLKKGKKVYFLIAVGVVLFMFSDSMIAMNKFKQAFELSGLVILSTYWLAIALLSNSAHNILNQSDA